MAAVVVGVLRPEGLTDDRSHFRAAVDRAVDPRSVDGRPSRWPVPLQALRHFPVAAAGFVPVRDRPVIAPGAVLVGGRGDC